MPPPSWTPGPSSAPYDPELFARLPAEVRGVDLTRISVPGSLFATGGDTCSFVCPDEVGSFAEGLDLTADDIAVGIAYQAEALGRSLPPDGLMAWLVAFRAPGAPESRLAEARMGDVTRFDVPPQSMTSGGKDLTRIWYGLGAQYLYAHEDTLYVIYGADAQFQDDVSAWTPDSPIPADVAAMIAALP